MNALLRRLTEGLHCNIIQIRITAAVTPTKLLPRRNSSRLARHTMFSQTPTSGADMIAVLIWRRVAVVDTMMLTSIRCFKCSSKVEAVVTMPGFDFSAYSNLYDTNVSFVCKS